jgi:ankyrin repeat protein
MRPSGVKDMKDGYSALRLALMRGNLVIARLLLVAGATVDLAMGGNGVTVLMVAAGNNDLDGPRCTTPRWEDMLR